MYLPLVACRGKRGKTETRKSKTWPRTSKFNDYLRSILLLFEKLLCHWGTYCAEVSQPKWLVGLKVQRSPRLSVGDLVSINVLSLCVESTWNGSRPGVINDRISKLILARLMKRLLIKSRSNRVVRAIIIYFLSKCLCGFWFYMLVCADEHT